MKNTLDFTMYKSTSADKITSQIPRFLLYNVEKIELASTDSKEKMTARSILWSHLQGEPYNPLSESVDTLKPIDIPRTLHLW